MTIFIHILLCVKIKHDRYTLYKSPSNSIIYHVENLLRIALSVLIEKKDKSADIENVRQYTIQCVSCEFFDRVFE